MIRTIFSCSLRIFSHVAAFLAGMSIVLPLVYMLPILCVSFSLLLCSMVFDRRAPETTAPPMF